MAEILVAQAAESSAGMVLIFLEIHIILKDLGMEELRQKEAVEVIKVFSAEVEIHMIVEQTHVAAVEVAGMAVVVEKTSHPQVVAVLVI